MSSLLAQQWFNLTKHVRAAETKKRRHFFQTDNATFVHLVFIALAVLVKMSNISNFHQSPSKSNNHLH